jgi:hypothetical protein
MLTFETLILDLGLQHINVGHAHASLVAGDIKIPTDVSEDDVDELIEFLDGIVVDTTYQKSLSTPLGTFIENYNPSKA